MNFNPFIDLIAQVLNLYNGILSVWVIMSLLIYFDIINKQQTIVYKVMHFLNSLVLPILEKIRKIIPPIGNVDISVIVLYLLIKFVIDILYTYFYG
jgi:YggT family protein